jgi:hypothetical protein
MMNQAMTAAMAAIGTTQLAMVSNFDGCEFVCIRHIIPSVVQIVPFVHPGRFCVIMIMDIGATR